MKTYLNRTLVITAVAGVMAVLAAPVAVASVYPTVRQLEEFGTVELYTTINAVGRVLWMILTGVAIIFFLLGGYRYLTAQGNAEEVKTANKILVYGLVALAVGLVARGLIFLAADILGAP